MIPEIATLERGEEQDNESFARQAMKEDKQRQLAEGDLIDIPLE